MYCKKSKSVAKNESFRATGGARVGVAQRPPLDPQKYSEKSP